MIKLLYITNSISGAGGLERVLATKASYLAELMDYEVHIVTLNQNDAQLFYDFSLKLIYHDIKAEGNALSYFMQYWGGIKAVVNKIKPDIISVCDDGLKGLFLPLLLNKPCSMIYERHVSKLIEIGNRPGFIKKGMTGLKFWLMDRLAGNFDRFVILTKDNSLEWNLKNLIIISNPLSFYPSEVSTLENRQVIAVGKQSFQKGFDRLLKSWVIVQAKNPDWRLSIYGKFDESQGLVSQALKLGIKATVDFFEPVSNIQEKYQESSIYVLSSRFEGFGMVLIEAMACGLPCVSFDCPYGPKDIISDNLDGFLVANDDISGLADRINTLIENKQLRFKMGRNGRTNVKVFSLQNIMPKWDQLFKNLVQ